MSTPTIDQLEQELDRLIAMQKGVDDTLEPDEERLAFNVAAFELHVRSERFLQTGVRCERFDVVVDRLLGELFSP